MDKRAQVETIILVGAVIVMLGIGVIGSTTILSQNRYVGDSRTMKVYDLKYCDINGVSEHKLISFQNEEEAHSKGFKDADCNQ